MLSFARVVGHVTFLGALISVAKLFTPTSTWTDVFIVCIGHLAAHFFFAHTFLLVCFLYVQIINQIQYNSCLC